MRQVLSIDSFPERATLSLGWEGKYHQIHRYALLCLTPARYPVVTKVLQVYRVLVDTQQFNIKHSLPARGFYLNFPVS